MWRGARQPAPYFPTAHDSTDAHTPQAQPPAGVLWYRAPKRAAAGRALRKQRKARAARALQEAAIEAIEDGRKPFAVGERVRMRLSNGGVRPGTIHKVTHRGGASTYTVTLPDGRHVKKVNAAALVHAGRERSAYGELSQRLVL